MTLADLYTRVVESTGLEVVTTESLSTSVSNCFADLTARGYRIFEEIIYKKYAGESVLRKTHFFPENNYIQLYKPDDLRKSLYVRVKFSNGMATAKRMDLTNERISAKVTDDGYRSIIGDNEVLYYIVKDRLIIEFGSAWFEPTEIIFGYYARLVAPPTAHTIEDLNNTDIGVRVEFEDAVVLYAIYFFYNRNLKEDTKIQFALNNYKYFVEDLLHELGHEDMFNESDSIKTEE